MATTYQNGNGGIKNTFTRATSEMEPLKLKVPVQCKGSLINTKLPVTIDSCIVFKVLNLIKSD